MKKIEELEAIIKRLEEENRQLKNQIIQMQEDVRPHCYGCGDILDGPHHSFYRQQSWSPSFSWHHYRQQNEQHSGDREW